MTDNPDVKSLTDQIAAADQAASVKDHRRAAALYADVSKLCARLSLQPNPPLGEAFLEIGIHYFQAGAHRSLYFAATAENEPRPTREDHADAVIRSAHEAIALVARDNNTRLRDDAYRMLLDGFDGLMASRSDLPGMAEAGRGMEAAIEAYRKLVSPTEFQWALKRLHTVRATTNMTDGIRLLFHDRNFQASQQSFKRAREFTEQALEATDNPSDRKRLEGFLALLVSMSNFGEALALQERGGYLAAAAKMNEAEVHGFEITPQPASVGLHLWAKAAQPYYRAMNDEIEGADDAAVKAYEQASKIFTAAADAFPASEPEFASMGSWVRFNADSAAERAKSVVGRRGWRQRQQEKAKRQAGLIFFGLWLIAIGASVAAARILTLGVNAYTFLALVVVCFLIAGVAAALIKADVAVQVLSPLLGHTKGSVSNDSSP